MIVSSILTILTALTPVIVMLLKDYVSKRQAQAQVDAPLIHQGEIDAEMVGDKSALSIRLSRLHDQLRPNRDRAQ